MVSSSSGLVFPSGVARGAVRGAPTDMRLAPDIPMRTPGLLRFVLFVRLCAAAAAVGVAATGVRQPI